MRSRHLAESSREQNAANGLLDAEWTLPEREDGNSCKMTWAVPEFAPGSSKLQTFQQQHIKDIVTRVVTTVARDVKGKKDVGIDFEILFEGHVDKNTDPQQYGELDSDRARNVSYEFIPRPNGLAAFCYAIFSTLYMLSVVRALGFVPGVLGMMFAVG